MGALPVAGFAFWPGAVVALRKRRAAEVSQTRSAMSNYTSRRFAGSIGGDASCAGDAGNQRRGSETPSPAFADETDLRRWFPPDYPGSTAPGRGLSLRAFVAFGAPRNLRCSIRL